MFDWDDLRHFLAVARHGSTIAAAKALDLSQSTVHRRLAELEKRIGRNLVIRHATGYRLTEFGNGLQPWAEQVEKSVASLARYRRVERVEDIAGHSVIELDGDIRDHHAAKWLRSVAPTARVVARSNTVPGLLMTVKSGAGLAPLPVPLAIRETDLVSVLGPLPGLYSPIYLLTHPDLRHMPRVRTFFDFIIAEIDSVRAVLTAGN